ncbi:MAG: restriction endonuclease [bacterium]|nr:restriction endonuclease [bacterium]
MAIPDFQTMMLPILRLHEDGLVHANRETYDQLALVMNVAEQERGELLQSGTTPKYENRAGWSLVYLTNAGLLERRGRGKYIITSLGTETLKQSPDRIDMRYLKKFKGYNDWRSQFSREEESESHESAESTATATPQERMADGYKHFRAALADEALAMVKSCSPRFFEQLVVDLLVRMGYGGSVEEAARVVGKSGDGGIDGIIKEDKLGLDIIYVQAKRWENVVGAGSVRDFSGSLDYHGAKKGVFITTSSFTKDAREFVTRIGEKKVVLVDGFELAQLMIDHDIGVSTVTTYTIKRLDSDYFEE